MQTAANRLDRGELLVLVQQISRHTDQLLKVLLQLLEESSSEEPDQIRHTWMPERFV